MLDPKFIRQNPDLVKEALTKRNDAYDLDAFLALDEKRRGLLAKIEEIKAAQNRLDAQMKTLLKEKKDVKATVAEGKKLKTQLNELSSEYGELQDRFKKELLRIPNILHESLPCGDASKNKLVKEGGQIKEFSFKPADHIALAENLDIIDFKRATKVSGSNFVLFKGPGARLVRALLNFMLDTHTASGEYTEISPPVIVNRDSMTATGQLPKLEDDMYVTKEDDLFLIPTAEVPVTNIHRNDVLNCNDLPIRYAAYTPCFRREAGSYGKDTRGLMRVHQFDKVELVKFVKPEESYDEMEKLLRDAIGIIEALGIPYRVLLLATGDISFAAAKCYDIEIYAPGIDRWLEVSSCSNFEDFQARRGNIRYKDPDTGKMQFVHTLNGSGVALARLIVAILENYQTEDGSIEIPEKLRGYMDGTLRIEK